ncbi:unnamed protein product [Blepharisma stoltei]|uniref:ODAD1 central coiled coil region domain-containing protein n=1 Tax=Blepharisma stoltei TaxID=1481888 RepID=A0AAU9JL52_9CILI|nr:unnamed protein product [Blepharisma stoltei]
MRERIQTKESPNANHQSLQYRQTIESLKAETKKLKDQMQLDHIHTTPIGNESHIARLQDQGDIYTRKIEYETKKRDELDKKIIEIQEKIINKRASIGAAKKNKETNDTIVQKIKKTEHKLDKTLQKYNEAVAQNKKIHSQIDSLRREKKVYQTLRQRLTEEVEQKQQELKQIESQKEQAKIQRDDAKKQLLSLKETAEREQTKFKQEWQELTELIRNDSKVKDYLDLRQEEKEEENQEESLLKKNDMDIIKNLDHTGSISKKDRENIREAVKKVEQYEEAFKKIEEATGLSDIDQIVRTFVEAEKHNYSLYNYVNELSNDIERLEKQIAQIKAEIESYKGKGINTDNQRKKIMSDLEVRLSTTESRAENYERKYEKTMKTINALKIGIQQILKKIGCNNEMTEMMLDTQGVDESNMMQCLGVIELRTNEILQMYWGCTNDHSYAPTGVMPANTHHSQQNAIKQPIKIEIDAQPIKDEKEPGEEDDKAFLTREEMNDRAIIKSIPYKKR